MFWNTVLGKLIMTFGISMLPVLELRGAIPVGVASGLEYKLVLLVSVIGNLVPVPFIIIFIRKIFKWARKKSESLNSLVTKFETRAAKKAATVIKYEFWGLVILVAIPLPGTGAWTGALVAAMLDMRLKNALPAIALGVVIAGLIVTFVTYGATILI